MPIGGQFGGRSLGQAVGSITVDTSQVEQAAVRVKRVGRDIEQSLGGIGRQNIGQTLSNQFRTAARGAQTFGNQIQKIRSEIAAVGVAAAVLTKIGLDGAKNIRNYRVSFRTLLGDEQKAVDLMRQLTGTANEFGIEVEEVWQLARALLPTLKGNTQELDAFVKRAALLASTNPLKSTVDASRAIQEYLAGQTISLQRLFNVDPNLIAEAQAQFNDVGQELDFILGRMGATEDGAREMADAWVGVKNELRLALAEGFTPLLETIRPLLTQFREWVSRLRESSPALLQVGAGVAAIAAVGAPALLFFGQLVSSAQKLKGVIDALNISKLAGLGGSLGVGLSAAAGVGVGIGATRAIGRATGRDDLANADLAQLWQQIRQILYVIVAGLSGVVVKVGELFLDAAERFNQGIVNMINGMAGFVRVVGNILPEELGGDKLNNIADGLDNFAKRLLETSQERIGGARTKLETGQNDFLKGALDFFGLGSAGGTTGAGGGSFGGVPSSVDTAALERADALKEHNEQLEKVEEDRLKRTLDATRQYNEQRQELVSQFNQQTQREEEDFLRGRRRQEQQFNRDVQRINQERVEQEAKWAQELNETIANIQGDTAERIADIQAEGNKRVAEIEEDYQKDRERREREHRNNLFTAAARLDATGIAEEQRRFAEQNKTAEESFEDRLQKERESLRERLDQEQKNLQERIAQERQAHQERIQEARAADAQRIADMRQSLNEQQRIENEDRAIRLQRARQDHQQQLLAQAEAHRLRLIQIREQAVEERKILTEAFEETLKAIVEKFSDASGGEATAGSFQSGGPVMQTGIAKVHGSRTRPEFMLSSDTTAALRGMLGNFNQSGLVNAVAGGGGTSINIAAGAIQVYGAPGQSANDIGNVVMAKLESFFRSVAN